MDKVESSACLRRRQRPVVDPERWRRFVWEEGDLKVLDEVPAGLRRPASVNDAQERLRKEAL